MYINALGGSWHCAYRKKCAYKPISQTDILIETFLKHNSELYVEAALDPEYDDSEHCYLFVNFYKFVFD